MSYLKMMNQPPYKNLLELVALIPSPNREICIRLYEDLEERFRHAPGAIHNHQVWPGGYHDHITEALNIATILYQSLGSARTLPFHLADAILVIFLHDLEKPFKYSFKDGQVIKNTSFQAVQDDATKREELIEKYGIKLSKEHENALRYIEGIRDADYSVSDRVMGELAAFCHCADTISARIWYDYPLPDRKDQWTGAYGSSR